MREVQKGVWHWQAQHPEWEGPGRGWDQLVSSYAVDTGESLLLFDPLALPAEVEELAAGRETAIVLTCPWHRRDAPALAERLDVRVYVPPPDEGDPDPVDGEVFEAGDRLPLGVEARPGVEPNDLVLWVESLRALVIGDSLIDRGDGLIFPVDWAARRGSPDELRAQLQALLELPVELVLPTHGPPTDRAGLERALS